MFLHLLTFSLHFSDSELFCIDIQTLLLFDYFHFVLSYGETLLWHVLFFQFLLMYFVFIPCCFFACILWAKFPWRFFRSCWGWRKCTEPQLLPNLDSSNNKNFLVHVKTILDYSVDLLQYDVRGKRTKCNNVLFGKAAVIYTKTEYGVLSAKFFCLQPKGVVPCI